MNIEEELLTLEWICREMKEPMSILIILLQQRSMRGYPGTLNNPKS